MDDSCRAAGVTKEAFFHHSARQEAVALAAIEHWNNRTGVLFANATYRRVRDPRERMLAYVYFRAELVQGEFAEFICLLGTLVQEIFVSHPASPAAGGAGIKDQVVALLPTIEAAKARYASKAEWTADSLAQHTQGVLQGSFVVAKALNDPQVVHESVEHLKQYVRKLLPILKGRKTR